MNQSPNDGSHHSVKKTVGLDVEEASSLLSTIAGLSNATSVLIITHEPELPIAVDQDLWLDDGIVTTING